MVGVAEVLHGKHSGASVELKGWIYRTRTIGGKAFVVLRDATGVVQVTIAKDAVSPKAFAAAEKALIESSVIVRGTVVADKRAPGGWEVRATDFQVVHFAEKFPIQEDLSEEFLLDIRHLWVRSQKMTTIFRIRDSVFKAVHEYFRSQGFWEVSPPMITPAGSEGGSTLFELDYFGKKAYLTQSWQLYAEALVLAMEKIYYVGPSFRAEKSRTTRHLTEYWHAEMEQAWAGMAEVLTHAEGVISHVCQVVAEERPEDVVAMGRTPEFLKAVTPPFEHLTYDEALKILKSKGIEIEWGKDLRTLEERALTEGKSKPIVVTHYPRVSQAFYKARDPQHPDLVLGFDVIAGDGVGEVVGGSERETDLEVIKKSLIEQGEDPKAYDWYLDSRRYGSVQHAGFGMGMERLIQWICKLEHIRDAVPFPRTPARASP
ncbi:MAG TPA: asparagine--tRNA ligase [Thermoplasmata archaeon]|nr:asparagine--tRNA ligase [Thermoplasmata archaeon]